MQVCNFDNAYKYYQVEISKIHLHKLLPPINLAAIGMCFIDWYL